ncbi:ead/Ea22-like family protein [Klebsiella quasipneumoniae]|uniref:ead/Ea22-like family protein n=1 Tax=Klebsiella quasipneumoniae TaxID=1463165 RepID=UPI00352ABEEE
MTDITELGQSLKNAASKALIEEGLTWFSEEQLSHEDGIALHKADAEFIALANPANVLTLVEALEKAQQERDNWHNSFDNERFRADKLKAHIDEMTEEQTACINELSRIIQKEVKAKREAKQRIAELESRTVTVKLPESFKLAKSSSGLTYYYADEVDAALTAQGIKVEAE